ncbi:MAG: GtrA family protein [Muribaculaceae bacterium]|nr:GtrA family protein [bacterium]MCM1494046.1 GtrA family protein [Muribaculaceae bacterium]
MTDKIKELWKKYEEIISYLIVGGLTTVVSWMAMFLVSWLVFGNPLYPTFWQNIVLTAVNWTAGVIFAYFTNRRFVFKSHEPMRQEIPKFVMSRISTFVLDLVMRQVLGLMKVNVYVTTVVVAVLVVIANYIFSKLFVFKKK